jgi:hypothetical protein
MPTGKYPRKKPVEELKKANSKLEKLNESQAKIITDLMATSPVEDYVVSISVSKGDQEIHSSNHLIDTLKQNFSLVVGKGGVVQTTKTEAE